MSIGTIMMIRNKLNQLLQRYYLHYPETGTIPAIYNKLTKPSSSGS